LYKHRQYSHTVHVYEEELGTKNTYMYEYTQTGTIYGYTL